MIKYFCDRCGKEVESINDYNPLSGRLGREVCPNCSSDLDLALEQARCDWEESISMNKLPRPQ